MINKKASAKPVIALFLLSFLAIFIVSGLENESTSPDNVSQESNNPIFNETLENLTEEIDLTSNETNIPDNQTNKTEREDSFNSLGFGSGDGSGANPYNITNCTNLNKTRDNLTAYYILTANIDFSGPGCEDFITGKGFEPIGGCGDDGTCGGMSSADDEIFSGKFEGQNYTISNLFISNPEFERNRGLFGYINGSNISNLVMRNISVEGFINTGGLAAMADKGTFKNINITGNLSSSNQYTAGLIGYATNCEIVNIHVNVNITSSSSYVAGLIGRNINGNISNSSARINLTGSNDMGGLVGRSENGASIKSSFAIGIISGGQRIGGLVGYNDNSSITNGYANVNVSGIVNIGGLVGENIATTPGYPSIIDRSYATGNVICSLNYVGGLVGFNHANNDDAIINNSFSTGNASGGGASLRGGLVGKNDAVSGTPIIDNSYWYNHDGNPSGCVGTEEGITDCTSIINESYFFEYNNPPMENWNFSQISTGIWDKIEGSSHNFPALSWENKGQGMLGIGTAANPYNISTCSQLQDIKDNLTAEYHFSEDLNCSFTSLWNSGSGFDPIDLFSGNLNGQNLTIIKLHINRSTESNIGLFGSTNNSNISNIGLVNVNITGQSYVGTLIGNQSSGSVDQCYVTGDLKGGDHTGGIIGVMNNSVINNSYSIVDINTTGDCIGGLVGNTTTGTVFNSYTKGSINGASNNYIGGLVGQGNIVNSFSTMNITGGNNAGGLVGIATIIINSHWNNHSSNPDNCTGDNNFDNCTAVQDNEAYFKGNVYPDNLPMKNWSFFDMWEERELDYPSLTWQGLGENISAVLCGDTINSNTTYTLTRNITTMGSCFEITGGNITIDGNGFHIIGDEDGQDYGIIINNSENIIIKNITIIEFGESFPAGGGAIYFDNVSNSTIENITLRDNYNGIVLSSSSNNTISSNIIVDQLNFGVKISSNSTNNTINSNTINSNARGAWISSSLYNDIKDNTMAGNTDGVYISGSAYYNNVTNNNLYPSYGYGILISSSEYAHIHNNIAGGYKGATGILLQGSSNNELINNTLDNTTYSLTGIGTGIDITATSLNNSLDSNKFTNNSIDISAKVSSLKSINLTNTTFETQNSFAKIAWNDKVSFSSSDLSNAIQISNNLISINSSLVLGLNTSATLSFYNTNSLGYNIDRWPLRNSVRCDTTNVCTELTEADTYIFNVTHFTDYSVGGVGVGGSSSGGSSEEILDVRAGLEEEVYLPEEIEEIKSASKVSHKRKIEAKTLEDAILSLEFKNEGIKKMKDLEINLEQPAPEKELIVLHPTKVQGWDKINMLGWTLNSNVKDLGILEWNVSKPRHIDSLSPGESLDLDLDIKPPLTRQKEVDLKLKITSYGQVIYEEIITVEINQSHLVVVPKKHEDANLVDLFMIVSNLEEKDNKYNIELNINSKEESKTVVTELYGPFKISKNDTKMFAYQYQYTDKFIGDYNAVFSLYNENKKVKTVETSLDLRR